MERATGYLRINSDDMKYLAAKKRIEKSYDRRGERTKGILRQFLVAANNDDDEEGQSDEANNRIWRFPRLLHLQQSIVWAVAARRL